MKPSNRRTRAERRRRQTLVENHIQRYGQTCPGWSGLEHAAEDLVVLGREVLCRSCAGHRALQTAEASMARRVEALEGKVRRLQETVDALVAQKVEWRPDRDRKPAGSSDDPGLVFTVLDQ